MSNYLYLKLGYQTKRKILINYSKLSLIKNKEKCTMHAMCNYYNDLYSLCLCLLMYNNYKNLSIAIGNIKTGISVASCLKKHPQLYINLHIYFIHSLEI